jgi:hypothetical protein
MRAFIWTGWYSSLQELLTKQRGRTRPQSSCSRIRPHVEPLEDRAVPAVLDLTTVGAIGSLDGGIFRQDATQPSGSGVIDAFVRLQQKHATSGIAQGYNTDARPLQFDEKLSPTFTRSLLLSDVPKVNVGGTLYREFLLDINQTNSTPLLSLDELRLYTATGPNWVNYDPTSNRLNGVAPSFDLGAGNWIELNSGLNPGSGKANMVALIPDSAFAGAPAGSYLYLYSKFGVNLPAHGGFEQWAVHGSGSLTPATGFISGSVFNDTNANGILNTGESGLAGWTVTITDTATGLTFKTTTDANGDYLFNNLATGLGSFSTYTISVVPLSSDWTSTTATSFTFSLANSGQSVTGVNFGEFFNQTTTPSGTVQAS